MDLTTLSDHQRSLLLHKTRLYSRWRDSINNTSSFLYTNVIYLELYAKEMMPNLAVPFEPPKQGVLLLNQGRAWLTAAKILPERHHYDSDWLDALGWLAVYTSISTATLDALLPESDLYLLSQTNPDLTKRMPPVDLVAHFVTETRHIWPVELFSKDLIQRQSPAKSRILAIVVAMTAETDDLTFNPTLLSNNIFLTEESDLALMRSTRPKLQLSADQWMQLLPQRF